MSSTLSIEFYTPDLPAPHAFSLLFSAEHQKESVKASFSISYLDRESCTPEELAEEGYTENDNIEWEGLLGKPWASILFNSSAYQDLSQEEGEHFIYISYEDQAGEKLEGFSGDTRLAYTMQELHQAVLEATEKELPLTIRLKELKQNSPSVDISLIGSFLERKAFIISHSEEKDKKQTIEWSQLKDFMETIYTVDFDPEAALEESEIRKGMYIETGDGLWFQIDEEQKKLVEAKLSSLIN